MKYQDNLYDKFIKILNNNTNNVKEDLNNLLKHIPKLKS